MVDLNSCVALYSTHDQAQAVLKVLQKAAFDSNKISIVGEAYRLEEYPVGFYYGMVLYSIGLPWDSIIRYEMALKSDQYLVIVLGSQQEVERAHELLMTTDPLDAAINLG